MDQHHSILFEETQQFRQTWMWAIVLISVVPVTIFMIYGMYQQLALGQPFGNHPVPDGTLIWLGPLMILLMLSVPLLLWKTKLHVAVNREFLHIRFFPFFKRDIPLNDILEWKAKVYQPLRDYGGWGIRWGFKGKAYNVSGNRGVQLVLIKNKKLLIGSQKPDALAQAITTAKSLTTHSKPNN